MVYQSNIKPFDFLEPDSVITMVSTTYKSLKQNLDEKRDIPFFVHGE